VGVLTAAFTVDAQPVPIVTAVFPGTVPTGGATTNVVGDHFVAGPNGSVVSLSCVDQAGNAAMAPAINALETAPPNTYWSVRSMHALYRRMARELDP